jgi:hypothetical protein
VFVAFGALISVSAAHTDEEERTVLRTLVAIGLIVLLAAVLPVVISEYDLAGDQLWRIAAPVFLLINLFPLLIFRMPDIRREVSRTIKEHSFVAFVYWVLLELPAQVLLIMATIGFSGAPLAALYLTALALKLFQAATLLARLVFSTSTSL